MKRYALIPGVEADRVQPYLPSNYTVVGIASETDVIIGGEDVAGWTLDSYVLPRLASGLLFGEEIDLSHPAMKTIPA